MRYPPKQFILRIINQLNKTILNLEKQILGFELHRCVAQNR